MSKYVPDQVAFQSVDLHCLYINENDSYFKKMDPRTSEYIKHTSVYSELLFFPAMELLDRRSCMLRLTSPLLLMEPREEDLIAASDGLNLVLNLIIILIPIYIIHTHNIIVFNTKQANIPFSGGRFSHSVKCWN